MRKQIHYQAHLLLRQSRVICSMDLISHQLDSRACSMSSLRAPWPPFIEHGGLNVVFLGIKSFSSSKPSRVDGVTAALETE